MAAITTNKKPPVDATMFIPSDVGAFRHAKIDLVGFVYLPRQSAMIRTSQLGKLQKQFDGDLEIFFAGEKGESVAISFDASIDARQLRLALIAMGFATEELSATPEMMETFVRDQLRSSLMLH